MKAKLRYWKAVGLCETVLKDLLTSLDEIYRSVCVLRYAASEENQLKLLG